MSSSESVPEVVAEPKAVTAIRRRGGKVFVWADRTGVQHVQHTKPALPDVTFVQVPADGFEFWQDQAISSPPTWYVKRAVWRPRRAVRVFYGQQIGP